MAALIDEKFCNLIFALTQYDLENDTDRVHDDEKYLEVEFSMNETFQPCLVFSYNGKGIVLFFEDELGAKDFLFGVFRDFKFHLKLLNKRSLVAKSRKVLEQLELIPLDNVFTQSSSIESILPKLRELSIKNYDAMERACEAGPYNNPIYYFLTVIYHMLGMTFKGGNEIGIHFYYEKNGELKRSDNYAKDDFSHYK